MSHITRFSVTGLAGRKGPLERNLRRDLNVFFGLNGSGKTSLLKILHSAMSDDASFLARVPFTSAEVTIYSITRKREFTRSIRKPGEDPTANTEEAESIADRARRRRRRPSLRWTSAPDDAAGRMQHAYLPTSRIHPMSPSRLIYHEEIVVSGAEEPDAMFDKMFEATLRQSWMRYSSEMLIEVRRAQEAGLAAILKAALNPDAEAGDAHELGAQEAYSILQSFLKRQGSLKVLGDSKGFLSRYSKSERLQSVAIDISKVEQEIEKVMAPRTRLQVLLNRLFGSRKSVDVGDGSIEVNMGGETLSLGSLSSGEKHVLKLLVETAGVGENSLLVDEPEISLHIDWQRDLIASMREINPTAQLIIATHSPEVMADVPDSAIFKLA